MNLTNYVIVFDPAFVEKTPKGYKLRHTVNKNGTDD